MTKEDILKGTGFDLERAKGIYGWLNEGCGISESDAFLKHLSLMKRKFAEELSEAERNVSINGMEYANGELRAVVEAMEWLQWENGRKTISEWITAKQKRHKNRNAMTKEDILERTGFDLERAKGIYCWLNEGDGRESGSLLSHLEEIGQDFRAELDAVCESHLCSAQQYEYARGKSDAIEFAIRKLSGEEVKQ